MCVCQDVKTGYTTQYVLYGMFVLLFFYIFLLLTAFPPSYLEGFPESVPLQYKSILNKSQAKRISPIFIFSLIVKKNWSDLFVLQKETFKVFAVTVISTTFP